MKLWEKNIKLNPIIEKFTVGDDPEIDMNLVRFDCLASMAHARMLGEIHILKQEEVDKLCKELQNIIKCCDQGNFRITQEQEDCHTAIENILTEKLGDLGKRIHTARSRNDQILAALRLYYKEMLNQCKYRIERFIKILDSFKKEYGKIKFPGYTHTRKAMVSSVGLWIEAFTESMKDNLKHLEFVLNLIDQSPLGTGAGYGVPLKINRKLTAKLAGFHHVQKNPITVQNSRGKYESTIVHVLGQIMYDLNRMATDLIFYTLPELGYFQLPEAFCTGSSIMPHKKNPDVLELVRAKYHEVISREIQLKTTAANLISGYHRDLQLTKKPVMEAFDITQSTIDVMNLVTENLIVNENNCKKALTEEVFATEKVYKLVEQGIPFREAYNKIAQQIGDKS